MACNTFQRFLVRFHELWRVGWLFEAGLRGCCLVSQEQAPILDSNCWLLRGSPLLDRFFRGVHELRLRIRRRFVVSNSAVGGFFLRRAVSFFAFEMCWAESCAPPFAGFKGPWCQGQVERPVGELDHVTGFGQPNKVGCQRGFGVLILLTGFIRRFFADQFCQRLFR